MGRAANIRFEPSVGAQNELRVTEGETVKVRQIMVTSFCSAPFGGKLFVAHKRPNVCLVLSVQTRVRQMVG